MVNLYDEILEAMNEQNVFSLSAEGAAGVALDFVKKYVSKAIDETKGKSKDAFMKENGLE